MRTIAFSFLIFGCSGATPRGLPQGSRLVTGELVAPTAAELGTDQSPPAFQLVGVHDSHTMFFGEPFDVVLQSGGTTTIPFRLELPCDQTVSLHFQKLANSSANQLGEVVGLVQFPLGPSGKPWTLLPWKQDCASDPGHEIKLGTVKIDFAAKRVTLPGDAGGTNPLTELKTVPCMPDVDDFTSTDDDCDGIPDDMDPDEDGDGIDDSMEGLQL
jgi:hypothetical protein